MFKAVLVKTVYFEKSPVKYCPYNWRRSNFSGIQVRTLRSVSVCQRNTLNVNTLRLNHFWKLLKFYPYSRRFDFPRKLNWRNVWKNIRTLSLAKSYLSQLIGLKLKGLQINQFQIVTADCYPCFSLEICLKRWSKNV